MDHPFDEQNKLERDIQLKGGSDPDNYKMPDGRTLTEVRNDNDKIQVEEYRKQTEDATQLAQEQSLASMSKGGKLVMDETGTILDIGTEEPVSSDKPKPSNQIILPTESSLPKNP